MLAVRIDRNPEALYIAPPDASAERRYSIVGAASAQSPSAEKPLALVPLLEPLDPTSAEAICEKVAQTSLLQKRYRSATMKETEFFVRAMACSRELTRVGAGQSMRGAAYSALTAQLIPWGSAPVER